MVNPRITVVSEGVPASTVVATAAPVTDAGLLPILALVIAPGRPRSEVDAFLRRHQFVPGTETARAATSQARWMIEPDGSVTVSLLSEEGPARLVIPYQMGLRVWTAMALVAGGTIAVMVMPDLPSADLQHISRVLGPDGGEYWHLSVGHIR